MSPTRKHLVSVMLLCSGLVGTIAVPAAVAAPAANVPCWKQLLNDWYDGTINNIYPLPCYEEAIRHLPPDVEAYSSAKDDIKAAEQAAANHQHAPKESSQPPGTTTTASTGTTTATTGTTTATTGSTTETTGTTTETTGTTTEATGTAGTTTTTPTATTTTPATTTPDANPPKKKHGFAGVLADLTPGDPQSFPLPLLVLGALAILLVVAGGAGMIWQRTHPRDGDA